MPWTELLTCEESLFETDDDITEGLVVLAPWFNDIIRHAEAVVITNKGNKHCVCLPHNYTLIFCFFGLGAKSTKKISC